MILALNLLHLIPDLETVLAQVYDTLPSGGYLISKTGLLGNGLWVLRWIIPLKRAIGKAPYVRSLKEAELLDMLRATGFEITEELVQGGMAPRLFAVARKP